MKFSIANIGMLTAAVILFSCHSNDTTQNTVAGNSDSVSKDNTRAVIDTSHTSTQPMVVVLPEQDFINYAVPKNAKEILWLKAGLSKGNAAIKQHSKLMLKDHNKMGEQIKAWMAKNSTIKMPALDTANEVSINNKLGDDWNRAWVDKSFADHNELLSHLKSAQTVVKDAALNNIITAAIPVVEGHLAMVKKMQQSLPK